MPVSSFSKAMALGELHEEMVLPYPTGDPEEAEKVRGLVRAFRDYADEHIDRRRIDEERWIDDRVFTDLGELGLMGLYVPEEYGGAGLSQTGYARGFEAFGQVDGSLTVALGVHQSIGMKGIAMFGSDEQKARFLPDLATGRKLAAYVLTEENAGSDAYHVESRAVRQSDGAWVLNGAKRYIGNGSRASVLCVFARAEVGGEDRHVALIVESDMEGFEVGERYDTMGLRGNDLRRLRFNDVRVPPEDVLGEPGEGFRIAMHILNNGRLSLGTGSVGASKWLLDRIIEHVRERRQFGMPLADFEPVQEKIGWMVSHTFGPESMAYLTTGLVDAGVPDYSLESAMCKVAATEFMWYAANRALQLKGGEGYMRDELWEKMLRDIPIFPIFEGANDVMRAFVALSGMKPLGEKLKELGDVSLSDAIGSIGVLADYVGGRIHRELRPDQVTMAHDALAELAKPVADQVKRLRDVAETQLRTHKQEIALRQFVQKRLSDAVSDVFAQIAVLSRVTQIFEEQGVEPSGQERYIAETFCTRAAGRVKQNLDQVEDNDDERMTAIAKLAYKRGEYGYAFFD